MPIWLRIQDMDVSFPCLPPMVSLIASSIPDPGGEPLEILRELCTVVWESERMSYISAPSLLPLLRPPVRRRLPSLSSLGSLPSCYSRSLSYPPHDKRMPLMPGALFRPCNPTSVEMPLHRARSVNVALETFALGVSERGVGPWYGVGVTLLPVGPVLREVKVG